MFLLGHSVVVDNTTRQSAPSLLTFRKRLKLHLFATFVHTHSRYKVKAYLNKHSPRS